MHVQPRPQAAAQTASRVSPGAFGRVPMQAPSQGPDQGPAQGSGRIPAQMPARGSAWARARGQAQPASQGAAGPVYQVSLMHSVKSEFVKLTSLVSTWILLAINLVLLPLGGGMSAWALKIMAGTNPKNGKPLAVPAPVGWDDLWTSVSSMTGTCVIVMGVFGVMAVTAEFTTSSVDSTLSANPHRGMMVGAKAVVAAALAWASSQIGVLLSLGLTRLVLSPLALTPLGEGRGALPWVSLLGAPALIGAFTVLAVGLGALCRSTVAGVVVLIGLQMVLPGLLSVFSSISRLLNWMGTIASLLPTQLISDCLAAGLNQPSGSAVPGVFHPSWWQSGLIMLVWAAAFYTAGLVAMRSRDIK
ncbi:ABC transporter permease [Bifidobacterium actinocoloniiforme]|nr:ABC transporter permease [Bifidobacterium actinocoloniiforme]AKV54933.1 hypothetical protein AB656_00015 [Bifidobacterium actinocoloniiforme DSM 22766]